MRFLTVGEPEKARNSEVYGYHLIIANTVRIHCTTSSSLCLRTLWPWPL